MSHALDFVCLVLTVALTFGFAPRAVLRIVLRAFPADDVRRRELLAEFETVPTRHRPVWVAEQLELGLFEGLPARARVVKPPRLVRAALARYRAFGSDPRDFRIMLRLLVACMLLLVVSWALEFTNETWAQVWNWTMLVGLLVLNRFVKGLTDKAQRRLENP